MKRNLWKAALTHCNILLHMAYCNTLQHTATHTKRNPWKAALTHCNILRHMAHCNTPQHTTTLQHTATHCFTHQKKSVKSSIDTLQHFATHGTLHVCRKGLTKFARRNTACVFSLLCIPKLGLSPEIPTRLKSEDTENNDLVYWSFVEALSTPAVGNTLQHTATHCCTHEKTPVKSSIDTLQCLATYGTLQDTARHCKTLQDTASHTKKTCEKQHCRGRSCPLSTKRALDYIKRALQSTKRGLDYIKSPTIYENSPQVYAKRPTLMG